MGATRIDEKILYQRAVERQSEDNTLRDAFRKLTANITRPGSKTFRNRYDQVCAGNVTPWTAMRDLNELVIEANAPDEDCLAFAQAYLAWVEQRLAIRDKRHAEEPSLHAALTLEMMDDANQDMAVAQGIADNLSDTSVQRIFDQTLRLERKERGLLKACRAVLASRGLRHLTLNSGTRQW